MKLRGNTVISDQQIGVENWTSQIPDSIPATGSRRRTVRDLELGKVGTIAIIRDVQRTLKI